MLNTDFSFNIPDWTLPEFADVADVETARCEQDGIAPDNFYLTSHLPTFYKVAATWLLPVHNSINCVAVINDSGAQLAVEIVEIRDLKVGMQVVCRRKRQQNLTASGIYVAAYAFGEEIYENHGSAVESSLSSKYELLAELMKKAKNSGTDILWVLGPSVVFDHDTRQALTALAEAGYVNGLLAGNAMATHDLEGAYLGTALGQNIYTQESVPMGHYNHLDLLNDVRTAGSVKTFINTENIDNGLMQAVIKLNIPYVLAGSIRDDGPLPEVIHKVSDSLTAMRKATDKAGLIICLATMLHSLACANLASTYHIGADSKIEPVFFYVVDVTENVANKISAARNNFATRTMITNVQDFVCHIKRALTE